MKMQNMRVDSPVVRGRYEASAADTSSVTELNLRGVLAQVLDNYSTPEEGQFRHGMFRIKSITLRAENVNNIGVSVSPIHLFGRAVFPVFRSNVLTASMTSEGHLAGLWNTFKETYEGSYTLSFDADLNALQILDELPDGVTAVIHYEIVIEDIKS